jgi:hypothetical protein
LQCGRYDFLKNKKWHSRDVPVGCVVFRDVRFRDAMSPPILTSATRLPMLPAFREKAERLDVRPVKFTKS